MSDVNDNDPVFDALDELFVVENTANGTVIGSVLATDADQSNAITYSIEYFFFFQLITISKGIYLIDKHYLLN